MRTLLLVFLSVAALHAQTVSPISTECAAKKCSGVLTVTNNGIVPLAVNVEAFSVDYAEPEKANLNALGPGVHLELAERSARVPPKSPHDFSWSLKCDTVPCAVGLAAIMAAGHTSDGIQVRIELLSGVFLCQKQKGCRDSIRKKTP
jgi:hypothetical protein